MSEEEPDDENGEEDEEWDDAEVEIRPCSVQHAEFSKEFAEEVFQVGGSSGSNKLAGFSLSEVLYEEEPEPEPVLEYGFYTNLLTGEIFKFDGRILEPNEEKEMRRYKWAYRVEKIGSELTAEEVKQYWQLVLAAKTKELKGIMVHDAMKAVWRTDCEYRHISSRREHKWKIIDGKKDVKARLVIKGFMDPQLNQIVTASATASALSHRMLGSYAVNHGLQVVSFDVSQAFLQGLLLKDLEKRGEMKRTVFFDPPKDAWNILWKSMPDKFSLLNQIRSTHEVTLQAIKGVYGLGDAPRLWRERFHEWMMSQGFTQSKFDECFYSVSYTHLKLPTLYSV